MKRITDVCVREAYCNIVITDSCALIVACIVCEGNIGRSWSACSCAFTPG